MDNTLGLGRPSDALFRDDVIAVDSLVSTHDKGKAGKVKWLPTCWVQPGGLQSHVTRDKTEQRLLPHPFHPSTGSHPGGICWQPFSLPPAAFVK